MGYLLSAMGFAGSIVLMAHALKRGRAGRTFRWRHLVIGRHPLGTLSRKHLAFESVFMFAVSVLLLVYEVLR